MISILKNRYVQFLLIACIAFGGGYFSKPTKVITKVQEKEVIKLIENKKEQKDVVVVTKKITKKDGTIIEIAKSEDKTKIEDTKQLHSDKQIKSESIIKNDIGLSIGALCLSNTQNNFNDREYGLFVTKRIFSNISVGVLATDKRSVGISLGLSF